MNNRQAPPMEIKATLSQPDLSALELKFYDEKAFEIPMDAVKQSEIKAVCEKLIRHYHETGDMKKLLKLTHHLITVNNTLLHNDIIFLFLSLEKYTFALWLSESLIANLNKICKPAHLKIGWSSLLAQCKQHTELGVLYFVHLNNLFDDSPYQHLRQQWIENYLLQIIHHGRKGLIVYQLLFPKKKSTDDKVSSNFSGQEKEILADHAHSLYKNIAYFYQHLDKPSEAIKVIEEGINVLNAN